MISFRNSLIIIGTVFQLLFLFVFLAVGAGPKVSEELNKHNLSSDVYNVSQNPSLWTKVRDNPIIKYKAVASSDYINGPPKGRQVCIFCHTPHSANTHADQTPLWNRNFSDPSIGFQRFSSATLKIRLNSTISGNAGYTSGWKPDGSSKLCLSCHDGVSKIGSVWRGGSITMISPDYPSGSTLSAISGLASFKPNLVDPSNDKMKRGHHPVSFKYNAVQQSLSTVSRGFRLPTDKELQLRNGKMQCTTCHDPHQNQSDDTACYNAAGTALAACSATDSRKVAPFWRLHKGSNTAVQDQRALCENCHSFPTRNLYNPDWPSMP